MCIESAYGQKSTKHSPYQFTSTTNQHLDSHRVLRDITELNTLTHAITSFAMLHKTEILCHIGLVERTIQQICSPNHSRVPHLIRSRPTYTSPNQARLPAPGDHHILNQFVQPPTSHLTSSFTPWFLARPWSDLRLYVTPSSTIAGTIDEYASSQIRRVSLWPKPKLISKATLLQPHPRIVEMWEEQQIERKTGAQRIEQNVNRFMG